MAEYTVQAMITTTVEYHPRMLQNFNSTPENDREAGFISVGLLIGVMLLGASMFLCNVLTSKFCPGSGALANSSVVDNIVDDGTFHGLPYSSEIRQLYLETALKSQEFCSANVSAVAMVSTDIEKGDVMMLKTVEEANNSSIRASCKNDSAYSVDLVDCCEVSDRDCHNTENDRTTHVDDDNNDDDDDDTLPQCLICFETFVNGDAVTTHCTNKSYHRHCIMEWLMKHDNCPYCRRSFFPTVLTNIDVPTTTTIVSDAVTVTDNNSTAPTTMTR